MISPGRTAIDSGVIGRGRAVSEQLVRSCGSIGANIEEGHGPGYGKQRNWFLSVAIGSARETKGWIWRARKLLSREVLDHRLALCDEVISLLVTELRRQRSR
jgi:four helix bundle protein